jgi:pimeloyl-ACP methyl ester carboxylesterase
MSIDTDDPALPIEGWTEVALPVERLWHAFADAESWPAWNPCFARVWVAGGRLREGSRFVWIFNPIRGHYPYRLPAMAQIVEWSPCERVTWEVTAPGFHALHTYTFAALGPDRSRFGSWEVAEGPSYRLLRRFWLAHFRYVCRTSLRAGAALAERGVGVRMRAFGEAGGHPPVVAIPGIDGNAASIEPLVARLAAERRVLVADYAAEHNPSLEELAAEIAAAVSAEHGGEVDLLGQSLGALLAGEIVASGTLPVRRIALLGTGGRVRARALRALGGLSVVVPYALQRRAAPVLRGSDPSRIRRRLQWQAGRDVASVLRRVDRPLLVVLGAHDRFGPRGGGRRLRAAIEPHGRVVAVPARAPAGEAIDRAAREIDAFLG